MLRELPIISPEKKRRKIGLYPEQIIFVEELSRAKCSVVVLIAGSKFIYIIPQSFKKVMAFKNLSAFGLHPN